MASCYFFKVTRDKVTRQIKVSPVMEAPKKIKPYAMLSRRGLVETCRVFAKKKEADTAHHDECFAAQLAAEPPEALFERLESDIAYLGSTYYLTARGIAAMLGITISALRSYRHRTAPPVRVIARIARLRQSLDLVAKYVHETLPEDQGTGNPAMGRVGNPDIWKYRRRQTAE